MRFGIAVAIAVAAGFSAVAVAGPRLKGATATYEYAPTDSYGTCIAFSDGGDVVMAGKAPGCMTSVLVARLDRTFAVVRWTQTFDFSACMGNAPRAIAMRGDNAYIAVGSMTNYVLKVGADGTGLWHINLAGSEMYAISVDPVDGTLWVLSGQTMAPAHATLYHLRDDGGSAVVLGSNDYRYGTDDTVGLALAVTSDYVYVGGMSWSMPHANYVAWLLCRNRVTGAVPWEYRHDGETSNKSMIRSLAAGHGAVCSLYAREDGATQSGRMVVHNPANGSFVSTSDQVFSTIGAPMSPVEYEGVISMHPTIPMVVAGGNSTLQGRSLGGVELWNVSSVDPGATNPTIGGVALSNELDYTVGVAYTVGWMPYNARAIGYRFESVFTGAKTGSDRMLVAPNVLDLSDRSAVVHFVMKDGKAGTAGTVRVFDMAGQLVHTLDVTPNADGIGDVVWNGFISPTRRIGPGSYTAVSTGFGTTGNRKSFLVVAKRSK